MPSFSWISVLSLHSGSEGTVAGLQPVSSVSLACLIESYDLSTLFQILKISISFKILVVMGEPDSRMLIYLRLEISRG